MPTKDALASRHPQTPAFQAAVGKVEFVSALYRAELENPAN
jgi:hypothetical protein